MFQHYLKTALRNLARYRLYTAINVIGLAVAVAFSILALMYGVRELTMDRYHDKADLIFRVYYDQGEPAEWRKTARTTAALRPALKQQVPEIVRSTRVQRSGHSVRVDLGRVVSFSATYVDPDFLEMFTFPLARGDAHTALDDPFSVVLDAPTARRLFGDEDPMGRSLHIEQSDTLRTFTVTGVLMPIAGATSFSTGLLLPFETPRASFHDLLNSWRTSFTFNYVELSESASPSQITRSMEPIATRHLTGTRDHSVQLGLQPLVETYLDESVEGAVTSPLYAYIFIGSAIVVLLIACINFTNLSLGLSGSRTLEVAVRKVSGAGQGRVMAQFWSESFLLCAASVACGAVLAEVLLPVFNSLVAKPLALTVTAETLVTLVGLTMVTGVAAGGYPSLLLSRMTPAQIARRNSTVGPSSRLGRVLVGFQFTVSIAMLIVLLVMTSQIDYLLTKKLGFRAEQILSIRLPGSYDVASSTSLVERFSAQARSIPAVESITTSAVWAGNTRRSDILGEHHHVIPVGHNYVETIGLTLAAGRSFSENLPTDIGGSVIINETAAGHFALRVGDQIEGMRGAPTVIGILEDYHFQGTWASIKPLFMTRGDLDPWNHILIRINTSEVLSTVEELRDVWLAAAPDRPLEMRFAEEEFSASFIDLERFASFVGLVAFLSITLAGMGVYGLASLAVLRRTKEVGVRKVLGATIGNVIGLFNREVTALVVVAALIACPLAGWFANIFLSDFPYRIDLEAAPFLVGVLAILGLAWLTVSTQALRTALTNPVDSLRSE
jgi:putative ABC transport system permease protein